MSESKPHIEWRTAEDYQKGLERRLREDDWLEGIIYTFMGKNKGKGPEALSMAVDLQGIRRGMARTTFTLCIKDIDLHTYYEFPSQSRDGLWSYDPTVPKPEKMLVVTPRRDIDLEVVEAYLKPYEGDIELPTLEDVMSIDRSMSLV